jgi:hypothetical protein
MSTAAGTGDDPADVPSHPQHGRRASIKDALKRFRTVLRRGSSQKDETTAPAVATPVSAPEASKPSATEEVPEGALPEVDHPVAGSSADFATGNSYVVPVYSAVSCFAYLDSRVGPELLEVDSTGPGLDAAAPSAVMYIRSASSRERAKSLFAKYGLDLEGLQWPPSAGGEDPASVTERPRVEKKVRQRVRVQCSACSAVFGPSRICPKCSHVKCKECIRSPARKPNPRSETKGKTRATSTEQLSDPTEPSVAQPGLDQPRGYVRHERFVRSCHKCTTPFAPNSAQICPTCGHLRCSKCTKDLAVPVNWPKDMVITLDAPDGVHPPRQRVYRKPRTRVRWHCHECRSLFYEGERDCRGCQHERCEKCVRSP